MSLYKYRIYCVTDSKYEYVWLDSEASAPTTCPTDTGHTVDNSNVIIVENRPFETIHDESGYAIFSPTYQATQGLLATWKGYLYTAQAGKMNVFDELIVPEIKISRGYYQLIHSASSPDAAVGDYAEMSVIDKDDTLGLFSLYGLTVGSDEVQTITFSATPSSGTFTLTYNGETTGLLAYNASAETVQAELVSVSGFSGINVTGNVASGFTVTFSGTAGRMAHPQITSNDTLLVGATISHSTSTEGVDGDVLELNKHIRKEYINPYDVSRQYFEADAAQDVLAGLYFRFYYNSVGNNNVKFKVITFFYES